MNQLISKNKILENQTINYEKNIENLNKQLIDKENYFSQEKKKIENEKEKSIDELKNKIKQLEVELNKNKNEKILCEKKSKEFHDKFQGTITHFENIDGQIKEKDEKIRELLECEKENDKLKLKIENLEKALQRGETKEEYIVKQAEEYYDVVIEINSINSLKNEGWSIKYNKQRKDIYEKIIG